MYNLGIGLDVHTPSDQGRKTTAKAGRSKMRFLLIAKQPHGTLFFKDKDTDPEKNVKTDDTDKYTQSFKAGYQKAMREISEKTASKELAELKQYKKDNEARQAKENIAKELSSEKFKSLNLKSPNLFVKNYHEKLESKKGDELFNAVNEIKKDEESKIFFGEAAQQGDNKRPASIIDNLKKKDDENKPAEPEYYDNSSIRKR